MLTHQDIFNLYKKQLSSHSDGILYGLVDHAGMPKLIKNLNTAKVRWISLFEGSKEENALSVAPILFVIEIDEYSVKQRGLLHWICEQGAYTSSLSFIFSPLSLPELGKRLAYRLDAMLSDQVAVMLRFFDPRIFEQLIFLLADKQKEDFLSLAYYWSFINRFSEIHVCNAFFSKNEKYVSPLILTLKQEGAMIDSCEPDQIADLLSRTLPEKYLALKICERHNFIVRHIADARMFGIGATHELLFFCSLALFFGDFFSKEEKWIAVLNQVKEKIMTLEEAASKVDADV